MTSWRLLHKTTGWKNAKYMSFRGRSSPKRILTLGKIKACGQRCVPSFPLWPVSKREKWLGPNVWRPNVSTWRSLRGTWDQEPGEVTPVSAPLLTMTSGRLLSQLRSQPPLQIEEIGLDHLSLEFDVSRFPITCLVCSWRQIKPRLGFSSTKSSKLCSRGLPAVTQKRETQLARNCQCVPLTSSDRGQTGWID